MERHFRYEIFPFLLICLSAVLFLPFFNTYFLYPKIKAILVEDAEQEAGQIAGHLSSYLSHTEPLSGESAVPAKEFQQAVKELGLLKVKVFSESGLVVYSTDPGDIGVKNDYTYFRDIVARGSTYSKTIDRDTRTLEGQTLHTALVEIYVPIMQGSRFLGAFEIYYDISRRQLRFESFYAHVNRLLLTMATFFLLATLLSLRKTQQTLRKQERTEAARRKAAEKAETERARADTVMTAMADGVSIQDRNFRVLYQNNVHQALVGGSQAGKFCYAAYAGRQTVCDGCPVQKTFEDGGGYSLQKTRPGKNGDAQHLELRSSVLRDGGGRIVAAVEIVRDISLQKEFEKSLLTEKDRLEAMVGKRTAEILGAKTELEIEIEARRETEKALKDALARVENEKAKTDGIIGAIGAGVAIHDLDFRVLFQNEKHQELMGGHHLGRHCYTAYNGRDSVCPGCPMEKAFETGLSSTFERDRADLPGTARFVEVTTSPLQNAVGITVAGVEMVRDITERKEADAERTRLTRQLQHSQKMEALGRLAGGVAHDFNNILTAVIGYGNLLKKKLSPNHPLQSYVSKQLAASEKATTLTRSLLTFGRDEQGDPHPVDIHDIIRNVRDILLRPIGEDIDLRCKLPEEALVIYADPGQIELVLVNLATNARDAMPRGGRLSMETRRAVLDAQDQKARELSHDGDFACLTVRDTGCGMESELRKKIFDPFFTTKEKGRGTGLGLSIVYSIVKRHGGFIDVWSRPGEGTRFDLFFPLTSRARAAHSEPRSHPAPDGGRETILIAEDDPEVGDLFQEVLREAGYRLLVARNGAEAVGIFKAARKPIDLLLFDVVMPEMNGPAACDEIHALRPDVPALFVSGYTEGTIDATELNTRGRKLLRKPVSPDELLRAVRGILQP